ncbi:uncharacterized protein PV09_09202 [Verruconis gallopava]|uniref:Dienelactone hydrolase domain-containing protein n=1 Tax=Verruconis gallopava TaxID=253628 RepID=A0A0D1XAA3_9PEZI|nr:uncharacterized protein PV09_09202 [Verruconis gallopava]KIV99105.1 hypothetical protein PV09_09202 [Verruconis gallopava]
MSCPNCFSGHVNAATPKGREEKVFDRDCYIAEPGEGKAVKGIIVIISDAFGWQFVNNRILADHYATRGDFKVYLPDFMDGTAAPISLLTTTNKLLEDKSLIGWLKKPFQVVSLLSVAAPYMMSNSFPKSWPKVTSFFQALRDSEEGKKLPIGAAGFCWGGKHTVNLCHGFRTPSGVNLIDAGFTAHPSNLSIPSEIEKLKLPLSIAQPEKDMAVSVTQYETIKTTLANLKKEEGLESEVVEYKGTTHGFAVRADESKDEAKQAEQAEDQAIKWFQTQFAKVER